MKTTTQLDDQIITNDVHYDAELWKGAAEMGWLGAAIPEEHGGAGFGYLELHRCRSNRAWR